MIDPQDTALASLICERNDHPDAPACDGCYAMAAHLRENGYVRTPNKDNGVRQTYRDSGIANERCSACGWGLYAHECPA